MNNRDTLISLFLEKNSQINLSAIRDKEGVQIKHINDSLELEKLLPRKKGLNIADVGTGGGFPLIPLAISHPECNFTGIDSVKKKTIAVCEILQNLNVNNVKLHRGRMEELKDQTFDIITARAVAYADKIITWTAPLLKKGGLLALMKQENEEEKEVLLQYAKKHKLTLSTEHKYQLFEGDINRIIYILHK